MGSEMCIRDRCGAGTGGRCRSSRLFVGYVVVVIRYGIVGIVFFGFVVVDDGRIRNIGYGFVLLVDGGVLGIDVSKVGAVVGVDVAVPRLGVVVVDGDIGLLIDCGNRTNVCYCDCRSRKIYRNTII